MIFFHICMPPVVLPNIFIYFIASLLIYSSPNTTFPFKVYKLVISVYSQLYKYYSHQFFNTPVITLERSHVYFSSHSPFSPAHPISSPGKPLICSLSLWTFPLWTFYINEIIKICGFLCLAFFIYIMFSRFIYIVAYIRTLFFIAGIHCMDRSHFIYSFISWWTSGLFSVFHYCD